jgi:hypothetical protein
MKLIYVTEDHIEDSIRRSSGHCMIADAIKDSVPGAKRVSADLATIRYTRGENRYVFLTPRAAQLALVQFDQGDESIEPFEFRLPQAAQITPVKKSGPRKIQPKADHAPVVRGGRLPPEGPLSNNSRRGRIRRFGLRSLSE